MWRSLLPSRQGLVDHLWGGLLLTGLLAIAGVVVGTVWGALSGGRMALRPFVLELLYFVGVIAIAVSFGLLAIRWLEDRKTKRAAAVPALLIQSPTSSPTLPEVHISLGSYWNPTLSSDADPSWPPLPAAGVLNDFQTAETVEALRAKLKARMMMPAQNELPIRELPNGIFGYVAVELITSRTFRFISGQRINDEDWLVVRDSLLLHRSLPPAGIIKQPQVEIIKSEQGDVYLVAFVPEEAFISLLKPDRIDRVTTVLRLSPRPEGDHLMAIPRERLCSWRTRKLENWDAIVDTTIR
jgi:hypothetical protein